jgi:hypothetical protein
MFLNSEPILVPNHLTLVAGTGVVEAVRLLVTLGVPAQLRPVQFLSLPFFCDRDVLHERLGRTWLSPLTDYALGTSRPENDDAMIDLLFLSGDRGNLTMLSAWVREGRWSSCQRIIGHTLEDTALPFIWYGCLDLSLRNTRSERTSMQDRAECLMQFAMPSLDSHGQLVDLDAIDKLQWQGLLIWLLATDAILNPKIYDLLINNVLSTVDKDRHHILLPRLVASPYFNYSKHLTLFEQLLAHYGPLNDHYKAGSDALKPALTSAYAGIYTNGVSVDPSCNEIIDRLRAVHDMVSHSAGHETSGDSSKPDAQSITRKQDIVNDICRRVEAIAFKLE